ncbi:hypothetical protein FPOAC2_13604 [Fusarium poae]
MKGSIVASVAEYPGPLLLRPLVVVLLVDALAITWSTRCVTQLPRERRTSSVCGNESPAPSQAIPVASGISSFLAQFEEWPLQDMILKRITEGDKSTFQLQFEWGTGTCQPCSRRPITPPKKGNKRSLKTSLSGTTSSKSMWTSEEDETVYRMKQDQCS